MARFVILTTPDGHDIYVNPDQVSSVAQTWDPSDVHKPSRCVIGIDGGGITVSGTDVEIVDRLT